MRSKVKKFIRVDIYRTSVVKLKIKCLRGVEMSSPETVKWENSKWTVHEFAASGRKESKRYKTALMLDRLYHVEK